MLPDGGNVLFLSGPKGNSQGEGEAEGLHEVLDPTGKYTFIGEQPFEVTNWDPAQTQKVLTAAIAKNHKIDVIVSDFGPSLVGALPAFTKAGRSIPPIATSDGNVLGCFWQDNKATNPNFKLFTIATGNDHVRTAMQYAIAEATGGRGPDRTFHKHAPFENSVTGAQQGRVPEGPSRRHLPLRRDAARAAGKVTQEVVDRGGVAGADVAVRPPSNPASGDDPGPMKDDVVTETDRRLPSSSRPWCLSGISKSYGGVGRAHRCVARGRARRGACPARVRTAPASPPSWQSPRARRARTAAPSRSKARTIDDLTPARATELGIAIVHQHPAVLPDMTVAENIRVAVPSGAADASPATRHRRCGRCSTTWDSGATLKTVSAISASPRQHLLELAKALALEPKLLILDEPTAPLGHDSVDLLFDRVRAATAPAPPSSTSLTALPRSASWPTASRCCATASCAAP